MATSRRRTAKSTLGQNLNDLDKRLKQVERRPRASVSAWSVTGDMLAPGSITLDKLDPALLALLQQTYSSGDATGDTAEEQGYGITDAILSSAEFSTNAANGKNSLFFQDTPPDEGTYLVDDIWYDTALDPVDNRPKYTPYQWDGTKWAPAPFGDAAFRFLNAGKIATGTLDAAQVIRVGQYPTPEGKTRLEISGGNGVVDTATTLVSAVTSSSTTFTVASATGMPSSGVFSIKVDYGLPTEEIVTVTARTGTTLTVQRGVSGSTAYAHDAGATVTYSSPLYAGITVLKNPVGSGRTLSPTDQANLTALFRLDASAGSLFIGEGEDYLKFNTSDSLGKLSISGQLLVGTGSESVAVGPNISGQQDGIRLGPNNWWYRPSSTLAEYPSGNLFFQVGMGGSELISVHTDGTVTVEGGVSPVRGTIKGRLGIRLAEGNASDKFLIGQDLASLSGLSGDEFDGIKLNANNYWVLSNTGKRAYLRVGGSGNYVSYNPVTDKLKLSGQLVAGEGTTNTVSIGADVGGTNIAGMKIDSSNFWYDADKVSAGATVFKVSGANSTAITVNKAGDVEIEGITNPTGGTIKGKLTIQNTAYAFGKNVMSTPARDGLFLNNNNYWVLSQTGNTATFKVGGDSKYLEWTGGQLNIRTDSLLIGDQSAATQAYADNAAGTAFSSVNVLQKLNDSITGVSITSLGYIFSAGKTTYQSDTNGWFIGYNEPPFANPRTPVMYIGNSTNHVKWTGSALEIKGNITGSTFTGGTFRTGSTTDNRVEMIDDSEKDRIRFPLPKSPGGATLSPVESTPAQIRVLPTTAPEALFFRVLQISGATVSGFRPPPAISIVTGTGSTPSTESVVAIDTLSMNIRGPSTGVATKVSMAGSLTITQGTDFGFSSTTWPTINFGTSVSPPMSFTSTISGGLELNTLTFNSRTTISGVGDGTTANRVLGRDANGYLRWYASVSGSGGYSNATDGTTENKITYGGTPPTSGRTAGDIHIEF